jgi:hypothetical protein
MMTRLIHTKGLQIMNYRLLGSVAAAAAIAFAQPVAFIAQEANKALEVLAAARKAIGDKKLDGLKTFSVQSSLQRNLGNTQISSDLEIVLDLPDKYLRQETPLGGGMVMAGGGISGFNGDRPLQKVNFGGVPGGGMIIRMGGAAAPVTEGEKPTPEQLEQLTRTLVRNGRVEVSRLMLGWFAAAHPAANVQYTYAGEAESPDGKAFVIDVKNADNFNARLFIDQQTHLPLMVTYKGPQPRVMTAGGAGAMAGAASGGGHVIRSEAPANRELSEEERKKLRADAEKQIQEMQRQAPVLVDFAVYFEDWREADGIRFPFKMRRASEGTTTEEWTVTRIKVNPKVDSKRFAGDS